MELDKKEKVPYPLFERQFTLFINSDNKTSGNSFNFDIMVPNIYFPTSSKCVFQVFHIYSNAFNPLLATGAAMNKIFLRSTVPQTNSFESRTSSNSDILGIVHTNGGELYFTAYDKTFFSFRTFNPFGRALNFRLTNEANITLDRIHPTNNPLGCHYYMAINVFFD